MAMRLGVVALVLGGASPVGGLVLLAQDARRSCVERFVACRASARLARSMAWGTSEECVAESFACAGELCTAWRAEHCPEYGTSICADVAELCEEVAGDDAGVVAPAENPKDNKRKLRESPAHYLFQKLTFMHIPKNAGTAVEELAYCHGIMWGKYNPLIHGYRSMPDNWKCSQYHVPASILQKHESRSPYSKVHAGSVFCIVRHPYERIVSHYKYLIKTHKGGNFTCDEKSLNSYVERTMRLVQHGNEYMEDCHLVPQAEYIWNNDGEKLCHHVLYIGDNFDRSFASLMYNYDLPTSMYALPESNVDKDLCGSLGVDSLSNASTGLLDHVYAKDFHRLNFQRRSDR